MYYLRASGLICARLGYLWLLCWLGLHSGPVGTFSQHVRASGRGPVARRASPVAANVAVSSPYLACHARPRACAARQKKRAGPAAVGGRLSGLFCRRPFCRQFLCDAIAVGASPARHARRLRRSAACQRRGVSCGAVGNQVVST